MPTCVEQRQTRKAPRSGHPNYIETWDVPYAFRSWLDPEIQSFRPNIRSRFDMIIFFTWKWVVHCDTVIESHNTYA